MLSLDLSRIACGCSGDRLSQELSSSVTAFPSRMIGRVDLAGPQAATTYIFELNRGVDKERLINATPTELLNFSKSEDSDGALVHIEEIGGRRRIRIVRTSRTTTPLYVAATQERVIASWDFWWVIDRLPNVTADLDMCRRYIVEGPCLYNETLVEEVSLLLGGQTAVFDCDGLTLTEPTVCHRYEPSALRPTADAALAFLDLIADSMRDVEKVSTCLELSGGYDSSCIAGACHRAGITIPLSYGIIQSGVAGRQQILRRDELIELIDIEDYKLPSSICTPLTSLITNPDCRVVPYDELYRSAIVHCVNTLPVTPDVVVSGLGGDELTMEEDVAGPSEPAGAYDDSLTRAAILLLGDVPVFKPEHNHGPMGSSALGSICRSDLFLTLGIWPKDPLAEPKIVRFAQLLPATLKRDRALNVLALAKLGLSDFFITRRYRENFKIAFENDLRNFDVDEFFDGGYIQSYGLASLASLSSQHEKFVNTGHCDMPLMVFANVAMLERILKRINNRAVAT